MLRVQQPGAEQLLVTHAVALEVIHAGQRAVGGKAVGRRHAVQRRPAQGGNHRGLEGIGQAGTQAERRAGVAQPGPPGGIGVTLQQHVQQGFAHHRQLVDMLMPVDKGGGLLPDVLEGIELTCHFAGQPGGIEAARIASHDQLPQRQLAPCLGVERQLGQIQVQADIDAPRRLGAQQIGTGRPGRTVHQGPRGADATQVEQMQHGRIDGLVQAEIVHAQADAGQRLRHVAARRARFFGQQGLMGIHGPIVACPGDSMD